MILPDFVCPSRVNQHWKYSGVDSPDLCLDKKHFNSYPYAIEYVYNSRGYRDQEWPTQLNQLKDAVWCIGDSFTVGLGSPVEHTWCYILQQQTGQRTINVSMDGASNNWIARQAQNILTEICPEMLIIHWSYLHRREGLQSLEETKKFIFFMHYENVREPDWPNISQIEQFTELPTHIQNELLSGHDRSWRQDITDDQLRLWHIKTDVQQDIDNTQQCIDLVEQHAAECQLIHSFIPGSGRRLHTEFQTRFPMIDDFDCLDLARDGHHYDIKTSEYFVQQIQQVLNQ
jgi:hypothetical protein